MFFVRTLRPLLAATALIALSGCYFGNKEIDQPGGGAPAGYYETAPTTLQMCATLPAPAGSTGTVQKCPVEASMHISGDPILSYVFSNPVDLQYNSVDGAYELTPNPNAESNTSEFPVPVITDNQGDLSLPQAALSRIYPMADSHPNCELNAIATISGTYSKTGPFNSGSGLPELGRIAMDITWQYVVTNINGSSDCSYLTSCYNGTGCTANDQSEVVGFLGNFVQTGIITANDLSNLIQVQYVVSYQ